MKLSRRISTLAKILMNYKARAAYLNTLPIRLWIETSLACNLECPMCLNKELPTGQKGTMDFGLYKKIIDEARLFVNDINIHHRGEPLLNNNLAEMIVYAKRSGLSVRFHTNATLLSGDKAEQILAAAPDLVSFSIDGFQKDIYEEIRIGAHFETTVANIIDFVKMRNQRKLSKPYVVVEKIDFPRYEHKAKISTVNELTRTFKCSGVNEVIVKKEYRWTVESLPDALGMRTYKACTFPWYAMVICWDGTVTACPQDYMAGIQLGNVKEKTIKEIWNDTPYLQLRQNLTHNIASLSLCRKCDRLCRKQVAGIPFQYLIAFLCDHFAGYGKLRKFIGTFERN